MSPFPFGGGLGAPFDLGSWLLLQTPRHEEFLPHLYYGVEPMGQLVGFVEKEQP